MLKDYTPNSDTPWLVVSVVQDSTTLISEHATKGEADKACYNIIDIQNKNNNAAYADTVEAGHVSKYVRGQVPSYPGKRGRVRGEEGKLQPQSVMLPPSVKQALKSRTKALQAISTDPDGHKWSESSVAAFLIQRALAQDFDAFIAEAFNPSGQPE